MHFSCTFVQGKTKQIQLPQTLIQQTQEDKRMHTFKLINGTSSVTHKPHWTCSTSFVCWMCFFCASNVLFLCFLFLFQDHQKQILEFQTTWTPNLFIFKQFQHKVECTVFKILCFMRNFKMFFFALMFASKNCSARQRTRLISQTPKEEVNLTFDAQRMEDMVVKGRARHHEVGIALLQRPHIIRLDKNDARNLCSHPGVITPNPFWGHKLQACNVSHGDWHLLWSGEQFGMGQFQSCGG